MKISRRQLDELIRFIARKVIAEYGSMSSPSDDSSDSGTADDGVKPDDAKTSYEKQKAEREARKKQQDLVRTAKMDLDSTKTQQDYFLTQAEKNKKDIDAKQRKLQQMKGAAPGSVTVPAGGTVAENIRKLRS